MSTLADKVLLTIIMELRDGTGEQRELAFVLCRFLPGIGGKIQLGAPARSPFPTGVGAALDFFRDSESGFGGQIDFTADEQRRARVEAAERHAQD